MDLVGGPMRRISARDVADGVTASNAQVARLAPPVRTRRLCDPHVAEGRLEHLAASAGASVLGRHAGFFGSSRDLRPNLNIRCATRRIWISSAPSVIR